MKELNQFIASKLKFNLREYDIFYNASEYETYNMIVYSIICAYNLTTKIKPHIVISAEENPLLINIVKYYQTKANLVDVDYIGSNERGLYTNIKIKPNTCLIIIPSVNPELGSKNDLGRITELAHEYKIPIYSCGIVKTDIFSFNLNNINILCIKRQLIEGYNLAKFSVNFVVPKILSTEEQAQCKTQLNNMFKLQSEVAKLNKYLFGKLKHKKVDVVVNDSLHLVILGYIPALKKYSITWRGKKYIRLNLEVLKKKDIDSIIKLLK